MSSMQEKAQELKQEIELLKLVKREVEKLGEKHSRSHDVEDLEALEEELKQI